MSRERDVVMMPCWRRPEFLWHCLDNLSRAEGIGQMHVLFRADTGYDRANLEVIAEFAPRFGSHQVDEPVRCPYKRTKQSANVLGGYLLAASLTRRYVFVVEEDIMVSRDFLRWHHAVQAAQPRLFCSVGPRNPNRSVSDSTDAETYYLSSGDYCPWGVCFERSVITTLIAPHVTRAYFAQPREYCARTFPDSRVGAGFVEQDGLIRRIQEAQGTAWPIAFPWRPRGFHAGYLGYHRPGSIAGDLRQRIRQVGKVIYNVEAMRAAAQRPEYFEDSMPVPLETPDWSGLRFEALPSITQTAT